MLDKPQRQSDRSTNEPTMLAARLHGPCDLRIDRVPHPGPPGPGQVLLRVRAVGVCGSDLHTFRHARIGDTRLEGPLVLGHEFAAVVEAVGAGAEDGRFRPLEPGTRVAVDPAQPCGRCELCERGHPNLCENLRFCGLWPDQGALCQWIHMPARCCFPVRPALDDAVAVMLEPLGVAVHTVDLSKVRLGHRVAILGAGPIGLCILQLVRLAGAEAIYLTDKYPWRLDLARRLGATTAWNCDEIDPVEAVLRATGGRGVDVAIEAAWCDESLAQAAEMLAMGGRLVVVGISGDDRMTLKHSTARRKGLSIVMVRRMKHAYPRAIGLAEQGRVDLASLVTHRFPLQRTADAFRLAAEYRDGVVKALVEV
jgi:L-iditol 2-dehydrogenase